MSDRPKTSSADEWALWLDEWKDANTAFLAVQIAEAIEEQRACLIPVVKPLVWEVHPAGLIASNNMGGAYIIDTRGNRPRFLKWPGGHGPDRETVEEMKAAAQADHDACLRACLDMIDPAALIRKAVNEKLDAVASKVAPMTIKIAGTPYQAGCGQIAAAILAMKEE